MQSDAENKLEKLLARAFDEPAGRPRFYQALLSSTVYVISRMDMTAGGELYLKPGDSLRLLSAPADGDIMVIPFFTAFNRPAEFLQADGDWIGINARRLFILTRGSTLVLNPNSDLCKGLEPPEIDALLQTGAQQTGRPDGAAPPPRGPTGPPEPCPTRMIDALTTFFSACPQVRAAYLAMEQNADSPPGLVPGLDVERDWL